MEVRRARDVSGYVTKDGSEIREIFHPSSFSVERMSVAEATVHPGEETTLHYHKTSDEVYYILEGSGIIEVDGAKADIREGDCIYIKARQKHKVWNTGKQPLKILCICSPPYSHEDTILCSKP